MTGGAASRTEGRSPHTAPAAAGAPRTMHKTHLDSADRLALQTAARGGRWLWIAALTAVVLALLEAALPGAAGRAVDSVVGNAPAVWIVVASCVVLGLALTDALDDVAVGLAAARSTAWLRRHLLDHFVHIGARAPDRFAPGDVGSRLVGNALLTGRIGVDLVRAVTNVLPAAGAFVALSLIDPWLCLLVAAAIPALLVVLRAFLRDASGFATQYLAVQGRIAGRLGDALSGARTIAASSTAQRETARVLEELPRLREEGVGMWNTQARIATQQGLLVPLLEVAVLALAGVELARGRITPGALLAAAGYAALATSLVSALPALTRIVRARAAARRVSEVTHAPQVTYGSRPPAAGNGSIEFRDVTVRAGERAVFDGLDLTIRGGELTAIVGRSGSGKSVLAALAGRLRDPDSGDVLLDGVPLRELAHDVLRSLVTYGFERPALLGETVGDAIAFGVHTPSMHDVVDAARLADADAFVRRLPGGYANPLVSTPLSGGETQRLGLARAFAHERLVLILDDVAASLDTVTDFHITSVLTSLLATRTRIVVAHRVSTASRADAVVWLEDGAVRAVAPHAVLWQDLSYRAIFDAGILAPHPNGNGQHHIVRSMV